MKDRIAKSVFWLVWSRGGIQSLSFLSTLLVARLLNPSDYGLMALAGIITGTAALLAEMGQGAALIQFRDLEEEEVNACFWLTMSVATAAYLAVYVAAPFVAMWFHLPLLRDVLRATGVSLLLVSIRVVPDSLLRKTLRLDKVSQAEIGAALVTIPVVVGFAWAGAGVWALVAASLVMPLVQTLFTFVFVRWRPGLRVQGRRMAAMMRYSAAALGTRFCWAAYREADTFVLGKLAGGVVVGFYSFAKQVALLPVDKVTAVVNQLSLPVLAELQNNRGAMRDALLRSVRMVSCITLPLSIGIMLVADDLVFVALSKKWILAVPALRVLCLYAVVRSIDVLLPPVLMAQYRAPFLFRYTLTLLGIMPLAFIAGAAWAQALGVAIAWVAVYPAIMVWMAREALREIQLPWTSFLAQLRSPLAATLVMATVVLGIRHVFTSYVGELPTWRLSTSVLAGAAGYGFVLLGIGGPVVDETREALGWVLRRNHRVTAVNSAVV